MTTRNIMLRRAAGYGMCDVCLEEFDSATELTQIFPWRSAVMADAWMCDTCRNELALEVTQEIIKDAKRTYELRLLIKGALQAMDDPKDEGADSVGIRS